MKAFKVHLVLVEVDEDGKVENTADAGWYLTIAKDLTIAAKNVVDLVTEFDVPEREFHFEADSVITMAEMVAIPALKKQLPSKVNYPK